ncbi:MAG: hypothetical protein ACRDBX_04160 [Erysipelotrichaceae bacterium]
MKQVKALFQLCLAFFITVLVLVSVGWGTLFHERALLAALEHSQYYEASVNAFNQRLQEDARPSGFPLELFDSFITVEQGQILMEAHALAQLRGEVFEYPLEAFKTDMHALLYGYIAENDIKVTLAIQQGVQLFIDDTAKTYRRILRVPFLDTYGSLMQLYQQLLPFVIGGSLLLIGVVLGLLYKMNTRNKRFVQDVLIACMSAGWMIVVLPAFLLLSNAFGKIAIEPLYFGTFLKTLIHTSLGWMVLVGAVLLLCTTLLGIYNGNRLGIKKKREMQKECYEDGQCA